MKLKKIFEDLTGPNKTPYTGPGRTVQIIVEPMSDGIYRALIQTVNGKPYGSNPTHGEEFMASGKTIGAALQELGKKLKM